MRPSRYCQMFLAATKCASGEFNSGISQVSFPTWYDFGGPDLAAPGFGEVRLSGNSEGDSASYSCEDGFLLIGESTRICQENGQWTEDPPVCSKIILLHHSTVPAASLHYSIELSYSKPVCANDNT